MEIIGTSKWYQISFLAINIILISMISVLVITATNNLKLIVISFILLLIILILSIVYLWKVALRLQLITIDEKGIKVNDNMRKNHRLKKNNYSFHEIRFIEGFIRSPFSPYLKIYGGTLIQFNDGRSIGLDIRTGFKVSEAKQIFL